MYADKYSSCEGAYRCSARSAWLAIPPHRPHQLHLWNVSALSKRVAPTRRAISSSNRLRRCCFGWWLLLLNPLALPLGALRMHVPCPCTRGHLCPPGLWQHSPGVCPFSPVSPPRAKETYRTCVLCDSCAPGRERERACASSIINPPICPPTRQTGTYIQTLLGLLPPALSRVHAGHVCCWRSLSPHRTHSTHPRRHHHQPPLDDHRLLQLLARRSISR